MAWKNHKLTCVLWGKSHILIKRYSYKAFFLNNKKMAGIA